MKTQKTVSIYFFSFILSLSTICVSRNMTAADKEEYERRGLSQLEWEMVLDSQMPMDKLDVLQKAGITVVEYFRYPWLKYGISEQEWIRSRQSGLLESDIAAENKPGGASDGAKVFSAFFLPGLHQFKNHQHLKGALMTSASVLSVAYMTARSIQMDSFVPHPLLILFPAMLWSSLDIGFKINRERNPDAGRFSDKEDRENSYRVSLIFQTR